MSDKFKEKVLINYLYKNGIEAVGVHIYNSESLPLRDYYFKVSIREVDFYTRTTLAYSDNDTDFEEIINDVRPYVDYLNEAFNYRGKSLEEFLYHQIINKISFDTESMYVQSNNATELSRRIMNTSNSLADCMAEIEKINSSIYLKMPNEEPVS